MTMQWDISDRARAVHARSLVWDAHACLPLVPGTSMEALERHRQAGVGFVSVNVGMDMNPLAQVMRVIAGFRAWLAEHGDRFLLAGALADVGVDVHEPDGRFELIVSISAWCGRAEAARRGRARARSPPATRSRLAGCRAG